jgi:hypothetical protein
MALTRRELLHTGCLLAAGVPGCRRGRPPPPLTLYPGESGAVLLAALEQLLPGGVVPGLPGAREAGVARYIDQELQKPYFKDLARLVQRGIAALDGLARTERGRPFPALPAGDQQACLARVQRGAPPGERFFEVLLTLALEGYLGAPQHGGNRDGLVWRAIGFDPARMGHE